MTKLNIVGTRGSKFTFGPRARVNWMPVVFCLNLVPKDIVAECAFSFFATLPRGVHIIPHTKGKVEDGLILTWLCAVVVVETAEPAIGVESAAMSRWFGRIAWACISNMAGRLWWEIASTSSITDLISRAPLHTCAIDSLMVVHADAIVLVVQHLMRTTLFYRHACMVEGV